MGRKILFITTDQQRHDALGCNGGRFGRTPVVDGWARNGIRYARLQSEHGLYARPLDHVDRAVPEARALRLRVDAPA